MRPLGIVVGDPDRKLFAGMIEPEEQALVQKLVAHDRSGINNGDSKSDRMKVQRQVRRNRLFKQVLLRESPSTALQDFF